MLVEEDREREDEDIWGVSWEAGTGGVYTEGLYLGIRQRGGAQQQREGKVQETWWRRMCESTGLLSRACPHSKTHERKTSLPFIFPMKAHVQRKGKKVLKQPLLCCLYFSPYPFWEVVMTCSYNVFNSHGTLTFSNTGCTKIFHFLTGHEDEVYSLFIAIILTFLYTCSHIAQNMLPPIISFIYYLT